MNDTDNKQLQNRSHTMLSRRLKKILSSVIPAIKANKLRTLIVACLVLFLALVVLGVAVWGRDESKTSLVSEVPLVYPEPAVVLITDTDIQPRIIRLKQGMLLAWKNNSTFPVDIVVMDRAGGASEDMSSDESIEPTDTYSLLLEKAGTYYFIVRSDGKELTGEFTVE